jgi:hypothetical protein
MARATRLAKENAGEVPLRCERCGRFDEEVASRSILGHRIRPRRATRSAKSTAHKLCPSCIAAMEQEQPELFGETDAG